MEFTWTLSADAVATLVVSREIEADDVDNLEASLGIALKSLKKVASTRAAAAAAATVQAANGSTADAS